MACLSAFNKNKSYVNHFNLIDAKKKYKAHELKLKRAYKRQQGNMMESLRKLNPKLFYKKIFPQKENVANLIWEGIL